MTERILAMLPPYPAPPFDVGFEAGQLIAGAPKEVARLLRVCLSGFIMDTATQDNMGYTLPVETESHLRDEGVAFGQSTSLISSDTDPAPLPLPQTLAFLLAHAHRSSAWTTHTLADPPQPPPNHIHIIKLGRHLTQDPVAFMLHLLEAAITSLVSETDLASSEAVQKWLFLVQGLPLLLQWWKANSQEDWAYPVSLLGW
jgi:mediator of RNA polymerase II transcription subunit 5